MLKKLGKYEVIEELGKGAMGIVFGGPGFLLRNCRESKIQNNRQAPAIRDR